MNVDAAGRPCWPSGQVYNHCPVDVVRPEETTSRHVFTGQLLGRGYPSHSGMHTPMPQDTPDHMRPMVRHIKNSRITVFSGGPISYLEPGTCP